MTDLGLIAALIVVYGLVSARLARAWITAPMAFVAAGIALGPDALDLTDLELTSESGLLLGEVALVIVLFADASRIDLGVLRGNANLPGRLLTLGMPITIVLGGAAAALLIDGLEFWEAAIVATVLAPTDAALGQAVIASRRVPQRIRQALNVESGLNDGLSVPFLALFVALAVQEAGEGGDWLRFAGEQIGLGALVGVAVGAVGAGAIEWAIRGRSITGTFEQLAVLALPIAAWALAEQLGGNGFIAAFSAGLATARITPTCGTRILDFADDEGQLLNLIVFFIFGVGAIGYLDAAGWEVILFAVLSLTVVRMLPVAIATIGTGLRASSVAFLGWFGPRGLASIILALVVLEEEPELPGLELVFAAMTTAVLLSVFAHGLSARPLSAAYGRRIERMAATAPERAEVAEVRMRGRHDDHGR